MEQPLLFIGVDDHILTFIMKLRYCQTWIFSGVSMDYPIRKPLRFESMNGFGFSHHAKFYSLTRAGRKPREIETPDWAHHASAIAPLKAEG
jgi:hypothetical protein